MVVVGLDRAVGFPLPAVITAASIKDLPFALWWGLLLRRKVSALFGYLRPKRQTEFRTVRDLVYSYRWLHIQEDHLQGPTVPPNI